MRRSRLRTLVLDSELGKINAEGFGIGAKAFLLDGFESTGGYPQIHPALAFSPPEAAVLQIGLLQLLGADVGMADSHAVVGASSCELAHPRHDVVLLLEIVWICKTDLIIILSN